MRVTRNLSGDKVGILPAFEREGYELRVCQLPLCLPNGAKKKGIGRTNKALA